VKQYNNASLRTGTWDIHLLADNALSDKTAVLKEYLETHGMKALPHHPNSQDIAPCDIWLNPVIKERLIVDDEKTARPWEVMYFSV